MHINSSNAAMLSLSHVDTALLCHPGGISFLKGRHMVEQTASVDGDVLCLKCQHKGRFICSGLGPLGRNMEAMLDLPKGHQDEHFKAS